MEDIWNNYPPELLEEAEQSNVAAEQQLINSGCEYTDPYNVSFGVLMYRWLERRQRG